MEEYFLTQTIFSVSTPKSEVKKVLPEGEAVEKKVQTNAIHYSPPPLESLLLGFAHFLPCPFPRSLVPMGCGFCWGWFFFGGGVGAGLLFVRRAGSVH